MAIARTSGSIAVVLVTILCLTGCLPATWTRVPEVSGRVVDPGGRPIPGAVVSVVPDNPYQKELAFKMTSDNQGRFHHDDERQWTLEPLFPMDAIGTEFTATASYHGAQSPAWQFGGDISNAHFLNLGNRYPSFDIGPLVIPDRP
jgi:hypothetical protein